MKVTFVGAGPGDPGLLTVRAHELLRTCEICIYAGSLVSPEVSDLIAEKAETHDSAGMTLDDMIAVYRDARDRNRNVVRLHTGDPSLYGAIGEQIRALRSLKIDFEIVPGISAYQSAAAVLGVELTVPEISQTVVLSRVAGRTPVPDSQSLENLARTHATLCLYLSVHKIEEIAETLSKEYGNDCPIAVVFHASRPGQKVIRGTSANIANKIRESGIRKTAVIIAGEALGNTDTASLLYDAGFTHEYRKGTEK